MTSEELHGEGEHKYPRYAHLPGAVKELIDDQMADAFAPVSLVNRDGAKLREIFPQNVQRAASDNCALGGTLGHAELKNVFVKVHRVLVEQPP